MKKVLFLMFIAVFMTGAVSANPDNNGAPEPSKATLTVQGACGMCSKRIEKTALAVDGVKEAKYDLKTKKLSFTYDAEKTTVDKVSKAIAKVGHDTDKDKAADEVYDKLPGCCKYRK